MSEHRTVEVTNVFRKSTAAAKWSGADLLYSGSYGSKATREGAIAAFSALVEPVAWERDYIDARPVPGTAELQFVGGREVSSHWRITIRRDRAN